MSAQKRKDAAFPHNMMLNNDYLHQNKGASGARQSHDQMERNFHNDRDKADVKGQSTTAPNKK